LETWAKVLTPTAKVIQTILPCEVGIFQGIFQLSLKQEEQLCAVEDEVLVL
jgi:hypothetical protein